mmetsp:Transcript_22474/g.64618  ORF Transcript_22474/g.64618 Transcript_22474/m.64618 type:complete len:363 (-) Transcript_22474:750-1838(-)
MGCHLLPLIDIFLRQTRRRTSIEGVVAGRYIQVERGPHRRDGRLIEDRLAILRQQRAKVLVIHPLPLGLQILLIVLIGLLHDHRDGIIDVNTQVTKTTDLAGVVGDELDGLNSHLGKNRGNHAILSAILGEAEVDVGVDRVHSHILKGVGSDLIGQADATPLLLQVNDGTPMLSDVVQRHFQLLLAIASLAPEHLTGEALIVNANWHRPPSLHDLVSIGPSLDAEGGLVPGVDDAGLRPDEAIAAIGAEVVVAYPVGPQAEVSNVGGEVGLGDILAGDVTVGDVVSVVVVVAAEVGRVDGQARDVAVGIDDAVVVRCRSNLGRQVRPRLEDVALRRLCRGRPSSRRRPDLLLVVAPTAGHTA